MVLNRQGAHVVSNIEITHKKTSLASMNSLNKPESWNYIRFDN